MKTTSAAPDQQTPVKRPRHKSSKISSRPESPWEAVRKDKVARAKKLLQDTDYPSPDVIRSVAGLLARQWHKTGSSMNSEDPKN